MRRLPWVSLALVAASVAVYLTPGAADRLVYDRPLVEAGQWWRLASAVLVHFSASHLAWDAAALLGAGWVAERAGRARFAMLCAATAVASSLAVHLLQPELAWYGGLSALAYAALAWSAVHGLARDRARRPLWAAVAVALLLKVALEWTLGHAVLATADGALRVATASHLAAVVVAAASLPLADAFRFGRRRAAVASLLLPGLSACTLYSHAGFVAPSAQRVLRLASTPRDTTAPARRLRVGVLVPREQSVDVQPGMVMPSGSLAWPITPTARRAALDSVAVRLGRDTARFASVVALPDDAGALPPAEIARRFDVDAICWLSYVQQLDAHDDGLVLLHLTTLFSPWIYPSASARSRTVVDLAVVAVADGRLLLHGTGASTRGRRLVPMRAGTAIRALRERDLAAAAGDAAREALAAATREPAAVTP